MKALVVIIEGTNTGSHQLTIRSIQRQRYPDVNILVILTSHNGPAGNSSDASVEYRTVEPNENFNEVLYHAFDTLAVDFITLVNAGDELFAGSIWAANDIFSQMSGVHWITGLYITRAAEHILIAPNAINLRRTNAGIYKKTGRLPANSNLSSMFFTLNLWNKVRQHLVAPLPAYREAILEQLFEQEQSYCVNAYFTSGTNHEIAGSLVKAQPKKKLPLEFIFKYFFDQNIPYFRDVYAKHNAFADIIRFNSLHQRFYPIKY